MEIERIDDWVGSDVVDPAGEKVGKLEDLYYAPGSDDPVAAAVKYGTLGKTLSIVPLAGASVTRSYVRVRHAKDSLKEAPDVQPASDLASSTVLDAAAHYDATLPNGELESGARRKQTAEVASREA
jgi:hypothetical protein